MGAGSAGSNSQARSGVTRYNPWTVDGGRWIAEHGPCFPGGQWLAEELETYVPVGCISSLLVGSSAGWNYVLYIQPVCVHTQSKELGGNGSRK